MRCDLVRYLTVLVISRLLVAAACPAPRPWYRLCPGTHREDAGATSPDGRLTRDVITRPLPRPTPPARCLAPGGDVTADRRQLLRPEVKAVARSVDTSDERPAVDESGASACEPSGARGNQPAQRRRGTHRGRRSHERKRGPRRHHGSWTEAGSRLVKVMALTGGPCPWLGLRRSVTTAPFFWPSGRPVNYTNWDTGFPTDDDGYNCADACAAGMHNFNCSTESLTVICYTEAHD